MCKYCDKGRSPKCTINGKFCAGGELGYENCSRWEADNTVYDGVLVLTEAEGREA